MRNIRNNLAMVFLSVVLVAACARDLSSNVYTSDSTLSLTLEGNILSVRPVVIKESDTLEAGGTGTLAGAAVGGTAGANIGRGSGQAVAIVGSAIVGGVAGAVAESTLGTQDGFEYIVKVDNSSLKADYYEGSGAMRNAISSATTNGLITVVQGKDEMFSKDQKVYVIFSDKRVRIIAAE